MSLTFAGAIALAFAAVTAMFRPAWTFGAAIFFMGFSGCAVANLDGAFGLQIAYFFFLCYGALLTLGRDSGRWLNLETSQIVPMGLTILLGLAVLISLYSPIVSGDLLPISVSVSVFIAVGLCVTWLTVAYLHSERRILGTIRIEFASVAFIGTWSAVQLACSLSGLPYPDFIFNNSASHFAQLYGVESQAGQFMRIGAVGVEPSILTQSIAIPLSVAATFRVLEVGEMRRLSLACIISGGFAMLVATSTAGYLALGVLLALLTVQRPLAILRLLPIAGIAVCAAVLVLPGLAGAIAENTLAKSQSWSYEHRLASILGGFDSFLSNPLTGVGAGAGTSRSLPIFVLANLGLVGAIVFAALIANLLFGLRSGRAQSGWRAPSTAAEALPLGLFNALVVSLATQSAVGFTYAFPDFWVLLGLIIAARRLSFGAIPQWAPAT